MSLDVYLCKEADLVKWQTRKDKSLAQAEDMKGLIPLINEYYEDRKPKRKIIFQSNITNNLNKMAEAAGIYKHLWRPEELGITKAGELIDPLKKGIKKLKASPDKFEQYNASNGWGMYEHFVPFVEEYLNACIEHPDATIEVSR